MTSSEKDREYSSEEREELRTGIPMEEFRAINAGNAIRTREGMHLRISSPPQLTAVAYRPFLTYQERYYKEGDRILSPPTPTKHFVW